MLTKKQLKLYKFLQEYKEHNEIMPKFDEMREHMNVKSKNTIHQMLGYIEWKGYIKRYPAQARAIKINKGESLMTKRKTIKKKIDKEKETNDWFDTHVEVMGFGRGTRNKKVKSIIKEQVMKSLSKEIY